MDIKVTVAFSNLLFSEGIARLLEDDDSFAISLTEAGTEYPPDLFESSDVILTDFTALYNNFPNLEASKKYGFILFDTDCGRENIMSAIVSKNLSGVLMSNATVPVLKKAIRSVAKGEVWIDRNTVKDLLYGINNLRKDKAEVLSEKEREIVALAGKGLRNKEIAQKLEISELTVKTHLHRVFKKLNIKTRSQLITFSIKDNAVKNSLYNRKKI
ncbi:MAG: response regulator transcription factor [Deltaproteobacteria bacterium]|nr:response regulator transcription factor [Deltaproteobacteria bacterium]